MPILYEDLCESNQIFLRDENLVDSNENITDLNGLIPERRSRVKNQLIENEEFNKKASEENYLKGNYKAKLINLLLSTALALLGVGLALAAFFIASSIGVYILPALLMGFVIVGITEIFFAKRNNNLETEAKQADNILNQLKQSKEIDGNGEDLINGLNNEIQEIKNVTVAVNEKIDELGEKITRNLSRLFTVPIPIPHSDPANELHNLEARSSSPTQS